MRGEELFYFANHGTADNSNEMRLMSTPLKSDVKVEPPDMRLFQKALEERLKHEKEAQQQ